MKECSLKCFKVNNFFRNILLTSLLFVALEKIFGFAIYCNLFSNDILEYESLWRPMSETKYWLYGMISVSLFYSLIISFLYVKICEIAKKQICLTGFAFCIFIVGRFSGELYGYIMYPYSFKIMLIGMLHGALTLIVWSLLAKKLFKIQIAN